MFGLSFSGSSKRSYRRPSVAPLWLVDPAIVGTPTDGVSCACTSGTYSGAAAFTYQWRLDGVDIGGATASTYTPVTADVGHTLTRRTTPSDGGPVTTTVGATVAAAGVAATTMRPPFIHSAVGGAGAISAIAWVEPDKLADGSAGAATSYNLYWGRYSEALARTVGPGGSGNAAGAPRTGITGSSTTNITGLAADDYVLVPVSVNNQGEGAPGTAFVVTVS